MTIDFSKVGIPVILKTVGVAAWALGAFGSILTTHIGADPSHLGSLVLGLAFWGAGSVWADWFPKPPTLL